MRYRLLTPALWIAVLPIFSISCGGDAAVDPGTPTNLDAEPVPGPAIHVTWQDNLPDEMGYELERKDSGAFKVIVALPFNANVYHDDDPALVRGTTYTYRIRAKLASGKYGAYSKTAASVPGGA